MLHPTYEETRPEAMEEIRGKDWKTLYGVLPEYFDMDFQTRDYEKQFLERLLKHFREDCIQKPQSIKSVFHPCQSVAENFLSILFHPHGST